MLHCNDCTDYNGYVCYIVVIVRIITVSQERTYEHLCLVCRVLISYPQTDTPIRPSEPKAKLLCNRIFVPKPIGISPKRNATLLLCSKRLRAHLGFPRQSGFPDFTTLFNGINNLDGAFACGLSTCCQQVIERHSFS